MMGRVDPCESGLPASGATMRISIALSCHDVHARLASGYPLGAPRVQAVEPLPQRYPQQASAGAQLPTERIFEGEVVHGAAPDVAAVLNVQRVFDVHATQTAAPVTATPASRPAISAYLQNSRPYDPPALGRLIDRFV